MDLIRVKLYTMSVYIFWLCAYEANCDVIDSDSNIAASNGILSRKRRYLIFPKGSSIQLVYDSAITIPDYTIYVVTGVTCALAWGLPDKPAYPDEELMQYYEEGALPGIQYRNDVNVTDAASSTAIKASTTNASSTQTATHIDNETLMNLIRLFYTNARRTAVPSASVANNNYAHSFDRNHYWNSSFPNKANNRISFTPNNKNYYYTQTPFDLLQSSAANDYLDRNANTAFKKYMAETYFKPWINAPWQTQTAERSSAAKPKQEETKKPTTETPPFKPKINKLHTIYPAMGKRSIRSASMTWQDKFYLDHHRKTRHELYRMIEKYLFAKGYNGTACVLKTLCEVGKKRNDSEPGSFLAEIVRAIFSLPEPATKRGMKKSHVHYDEAHQNTDDCVQTFENCSASIWNVGYKLIELK